MAETITPGAEDRNGSLIRNRNIENDPSVWTTSPGFQYAEAKDLIKNGSVYKSIYHIWGEGAPSSNYDNATTGSIYTDLDNGAVYHRVLADDDSTQAWGVVPFSVAGDATTSYTNHPGGGVIAFDSNSVDLKVAAEDADGDLALAGS